MSDEPIKDPTSAPKPTGDSPRTQPPSKPATQSASPPPPPAPAGNGFPVGLLFFLVLSVLLAVFAVQNTQDVELEFLGWRGQFPLIMIVVGVFAIAVVLDEILGAVLRRRKQVRRAEKQELQQYRKKK